MRKIWHGFSMKASLNVLKMVTTYFMTILLLGRNLPRKANLKTLQRPKFQNSKNSCSDLIYILLFILIFKISCRQLLSKAASDGRVTELGVTQTAGPQQGLAGWTDEVSLRTLVDRGPRDLEAHGTLQLRLNLRPFRLRKRAFLHLPRPHHAVGGAPQIQLRNLFL